ncbi:MAG: helix-turn-helix domain-containing protein [Chitinophagaceae bacterium]
MDNPFSILQEEMQQMKSILIEVQELLIKQNSDRKEKYLSPNEARALFYPAISKSTLYRWTLEGLIKKHRIGGKACYKLSEIETATKSLKSYKQKAPIKMEAA